MKAKELAALLLDYPEVEVLIWVRGGLSPVTGMRSVGSEDTDPYLQILSEFDEVPRHAPLS